MIKIVQVAAVLLFKIGHRLLLYAHKQNMFICIMNGHTNVMKISFHAVFDVDIAICKDKSREIQF